MGLGQEEIQVVEGKEGRKGGRQGEKEEGRKGKRRGRERKKIEMHFLKTKYPQLKRRVIKEAKSIKYVF